MLSPDRDLDEEQKRSLEITNRIREKITDYNRYRFTAHQSCALNIFFDLAQEYEDIRHLYHLPVKVLRLFFELDSEFYVLSRKHSFELRTQPVSGAISLPPLSELLEGPVRQDQIWFFPARGRIWNLAEAADQNIEVSESGLGVLGVLVLYPKTPLSEHDRLYYEKFANRVGFALHNRLLAQKNREHINFVRNLVHDIGHNVITPNLYFKLLMKQMEGKIKALGEISRDLNVECRSETLQALSNLYARILEQYGEIVRHFHQSSFFLETLLRQSHFDKGEYVLQKNRLDILKRVVLPQVERYRVRFEEKNIAVEEHYPTEGASPMVVEADMGLVSQVLANIFSNALKYTRPTPGREDLFMRCSVDCVAVYFGKGQDGVKISITTSGPAIDPKEALRLFEENFRASNTEHEYGTGHGLHFIKIIIAQHNGESGYNRAQDGNEFYVILPCVDND